MGAAHLEKCDIIVVTIRTFPGKETKRMAVLAQSSSVFTTLQESLRIQKDSILGIMDKDWSTTFKFVPPCRNELLRSKMAHLDG